MATVFFWACPLFNGKIGCYCSYGSKGGSLVHWQDVNCGTLCPLLSAKWVPPRPSLAGNNGDSSARFQDEVGALLALLEHKGIGYRIC